MLLLAITVLYVSTGFSQESEKKPHKELKPKTKTEARQVQLSSQVAESEKLHFLRVPADLGEVDCGEKLRILLSVTSSLEDETLFFDQVKVSSSRVTCKASTNTLAFGETAIFEILLEVPDNATRPEFGSSIRLESTIDESARPIQIDLSCKLRGLVSIPQKHAFLYVTEGEPVAETNIPIVITHPVESSDLKLSISPELKDLPISIADTPDGLFLQISASFSDVQSSSIGGEIVVESKTTGRKAWINCTVRNSAAVTVSPEHLSLSESADSPKLFDGSVLIKIAESEEEHASNNSDDSETRKKPRFSLAIEGSSVPVKAKQLGSSRIYRVTFAIRKPKKEVKNLVLDWKIRQGNQTHAPQTYVVFEE